MVTRKKDDRGRGKERGVRRDEGLVHRETKGVEGDIHAWFLKPTDIPTARFHILIYPPSVTSSSQRHSIYSLLVMANFNCSLVQVYRFPSRLTNKTKKSAAFSIHILVFIVSNSNLTIKSVYSTSFDRVASSPVNTPLSSPETSTSSDRLVFIHQLLDGPKPWNTLLLLACAIPINLRPTIL